MPKFLGLSYSIWIGLVVAGTYICSILNAWRGNASQILHL